MDQLTQDALRLWPGLAQQIGVDPDTYHPVEIARRQDHRVSMLVLKMRAEGAPSLALKFRPRPVDVARFKDVMAVQKRVEAAYPDGVAHILAIDPAAQAFVMSYLDGVPLINALEVTMPDEHPGLLCRVGRWLDGFHRATQAEQREFKPKFTLTYLASLLSQLNKGARKIPKPNLFRQYARGLLDNSAAYEGKHTITALTHGDLHLRNVLVGQKVWGLDFAADRNVPVGHDIGRLLADYAIFAAPQVSINPGEVLPRMMLDGFFRGYTLVGADDPSVQLLVRHRILAEWWGIPADADKRSFSQERRWQGILRLMKQTMA